MLGAVIGLPESHAASNRWLLGTGIVFPSLNGSLSFNSAAIPWMGATAIGADYLFPETGGVGSGRTAIASLASGRGSWGGGAGVISNWTEGGVSAQTYQGFGAIGGMFGDLGLGLMAQKLLTHPGGDLSLSYGAHYRLSGGMSFAAVLPSGFDSVKLGLGWRRGGAFAFELNADVPLESSGSTGLSFGAKGEGEVIGASVILTSELSSGSGLSDPGVALALSGRLSSRLVLIAQRPADGLYTLGFNLAL